MQDSGGKPVHTSPLAAPRVRHSCWRYCVLSIENSLPDKSIVTEGLSAMSSCAGKSSVRELSLRLRTWRVAIHSPARARRGMAPRRLLLFSRMPTTRQRLLSARVPVTVPLRQPHGKSSELRTAACKWRICLRRVAALLWSNATALLPLAAMQLYMSRPADDA